MNSRKIWLSSPHLGGTEEAFVHEAFRTNWISPLGPNVDGFEADVSSFLGDGVHVAALSSGTASIHLALVLLNVQPGDEVICQSMTFSATANPIAYLGARPVFIDSEKETWNMDPEFLEEAIVDRIAKGKRPKAIIVVDLYGMPAKMEELLSIARRYDIPLIEDAAEALGSSINGKRCGTFGDMAILSFNGNKIITTSGGGALVSRNADYVKRARFLATQARDPAPHYQHSQIGYNYRMSNICAGIGRGQMEVIGQRVAQRRSNHAFYREALGRFGEFHFLDEPPGYYSNRWLTCMLLDATPGDKRNRRDELRERMEEKNIECRPVWKPMHLQPVYAGALYYGANASEQLFQSGLCLPSGSNLTRDDLEAVIHCVIDVFQHVNI